MIRYPFLPIIRVPLLRSFNGPFPSLLASTSVQIFKYLNILVVVSFFVMEVTQPFARIATITFSSAFQRAFPWFSDTFLASKNLRLLPLFSTDILRTDHIYVASVTAAVTLFYVSNSVILTKGLKCFVIPYQGAAKWEMRLCGLTVGACVVEKGG